MTHFTAKEAKALLYDSLYPSVQKFIDKEIKDACLSGFDHKSMSKSQVEFGSHYGDHIDLNLLADMYRSRGYYVDTTFSSIAIWWIKPNLRKPISTPIKPDQEPLQLQHPPWETAPQKARDKRDEESRPSKCELCGLTGLVKITNCHYVICRSCALLLSAQELTSISRVTLDFQRKSEDTAILFNLRNKIQKLKEDTLAKGRETSDVKKEEDVKERDLADVFAKNYVDGAPEKTNQGYWKLREVFKANPSVVMGNVWELKSYEQTDPEMKARFIKYVIKYLSEKLEK
jgi:hypothetical protein